MKYITGIVTGVLSLLAPVEPLLLCAMAFVAVDFLTGVLADRRRARTEGRAWRFESRKAWKTIRKLAFVMAGIVLAWLLDGIASPFVELRLANLFTGFVCGVEFWSYLENASVVTGERRFVDVLLLFGRRLRSLLGRAE